MLGDQVGDQDTKAWNVAQEFGEELRHYSYEACPGRRETASAVFLSPASDCVSCNDLRS